MAVYLPEHNLTYFSLPKVACSSLKRLFFQIENGRAYENSLANGEEQHIHNTHYPCILFKNARKIHRNSAHRIAVVRDPVRRVMSAYNNKVLGKGALSASQIGKKTPWSRIGPDPDFETFVDRLPQYRKASSEIDWHARPIVDFLGEDAAFFTQLYRFDQLGEMASFIGEITATSYSLPHANPSKPTSSARITLADVSARTRHRLEQLYRQDYATFGRYF